MTRSSKTEGWRVRRRAAGSIGKRVSSPARDDRTERFCFFSVGDRRFRPRRPPRVREKTGRGKAAPEDIADSARNAQGRACAYVHGILCFAFVSRSGRRGVVRQIHHRDIRFRFRRGGGLGRGGVLGTAPPEEAAYVARHRTRRGTVSRASSEAFDKSRVPGSGEIARGAYACLKIFFLGAKGNHAGSCLPPGCRHRSRTTATLWNENLRS